MTHPLQIFRLLFLLSAGSAFSQSYNMNGTPINDCSGTFYDSGGGTGNYGNNQNLVTTICSDNTSGTHIQLNFSGVDLAPGDEICFYDGSSTAAPLLSCSSDYAPGSPFIIQATAVNPGGCLTVTFNSDAAGTATGWSAVISCVPSCQTVLADLVSTNPVSVPLDTGWIDVCPGERIFFTGAGVYPQNGFSYQQSDLTTIFEWNFGDGDISYGPATSHRYDDAGGYFVQLFLRDVQGCRSTNLINQRIRVAPRPSFALTGMLDNTICAGDTVQLNAGFNAGSTDKTLVILPITSAFASEGSRSDSLPLPDGTGIPYETSIFFTEFSPGQVLTNPNDLESICVNMEHSWMRDMEISISCPNGQSIILHNFGGQTGSEIFLGIPNDNDFFNPIPGTGYDYCWTPTATNPTWLQYANTFLPAGGTLPSGNYTPFEPFSNLVGCPLNGEWTITVTDLWPIDNGYIFSWSLKLKDALYPQIESFTPQFTSWGWNNHPSVFYSTTDSIAASPQNGGTAGYIFTVNDDFGCSWDTLVDISVLPFTHPACYRCADNHKILGDTSVCAMEPVLLNAGTTAPDTFEVRFEAYPDYKLGNGNHPHNNPYLSPISVNSMGYNFLSTPLTQITSVCMDIETDFDADLNVYLRSPDGKQLELTTGNGAAGDNYKITCFSPAATLPIVGNTAPFNGTYKPEGNWASLNNAVVNGDWKLVVSDGFGINQYGKVKWWSIGFNFFNASTYSWTNNATLSCNNCPAPVAMPSATTTYTVSATDKFNCTHSDTVTVEVINLFPAPGNLNVTGFGTGSMTWGWDPVQGATGYEVSINGGPWIAASGNNSHTVNGLISGDTVNLEVRALGGSINCPPSVANGQSVYIACNFTASVTSTQPVLCAGGSTGSALISVMNATPPVEYYPDGMMPPLSSGNLMNIFPAGNHFVIIKDASGCRDTVYFNITEPLPIDVNVSVTDALCNGDPDGALSALATGGTGALSYSWQGCSGGTIINNANASDLYAGCYTLTVTDTKGCSITSTATVNEPLPFMFSGVQTPVSCNGGSDGTATINVTGGTMPYTYDWAASAINAPTITGLTAGFYFVNVTDTLGCEAATFVQVFEPPPLVLDSVATKAASCFGGNNGTATVYVKGGGMPYTYLWSNMQVTQKAINLAAGTYMVTVTDNKGCTLVSTAVVTSPTAIATSFTNIVDEKCAGDCSGQATIQVSGGTMPYTYSWSGTSLPVTDPTATGLCPGVYMVMVQDFRGCTASDKVTIGAATPIEIHLQPTVASCAGVSNGSITADVTGGVSPYQLAWSNGGSGLVNPNLLCGNFVLTVTDNAGCIKTDSIDLPCPASIQIAAVIPQPVKCFGGGDGQVSVQASGGTGLLNYSWSDPNGQTGSTAVGLTAGAYTVTITDGNGCSITATATVTQPQAISATVSKTDVSCLGGSNGTATAFPVGGTPAYTFDWGAGQNNQQIKDIPAGSYTVTVSDANGCSVTATATVSEPATAVTVVVTQTQTACFGGSNGAAFATASGGNGTPYTYSWSNGQIGQNANALGLGFVTVTATDSKGCTAIQNIEIQQFDSIDANIAFVAPTCFGYSNGQAAINMVTGGAGMGDTTKYIYEWSAPNTSSTIFINGLTGDQTYFLTITDLQGCSGVFSFFVNQPPDMQLDKNISNISCFGFSDGSIEINGISNANLPVAYTWDNGATGPVLNNLAAGNYILTIQDAKGCIKKDTSKVVEPPALALQFAVSPLLCSGDSSAAIQANIQGGTPPYSLLWNTGSTDVSIQKLGPGMYALGIIDANGCVLSDSVRIDRPDSTAISVEKTEPGCFGTSNGKIKLSVTGGAPPYRYSINGGPFGGSSSFIGLSAGVYTFQIRDANNCVTTIIDSLGQPLPVEVNLGPDTTIVLGDSVFLSPDIFNAFGMVEYKWRSVLLEEFPCVDTPECSIILAKPYQSNTYQVTITDENGCRGTASITVEVLKPRGVYVPTGFTPNDDLNNDLLVVYGKSNQILNVLSFRVFDRWGELLYQDNNFKVNDESRGWNGLFRGKACDPGVYVWHVEVEYRDGYRESLSGNVTLIR